MKLSPNVTCFCLIFLAFTGLGACVAPPAKDRPAISEQTMENLHNTPDISGRISTKMMHTLPVNHARPFHEPAPIDDPRAFSSDAPAAPLYRPFENGLWHPRHQAHHPDYESNSKYLNGVSRQLKAQMPAYRLQEPDSVPEAEPTDD